MTGDPIEAAIAEAQRRQALSDRDVSAPMQHFAATVRSLCQDWGLTVESWLAGGASTPVVAVTRADGTQAVLKIADPGALDAAAGVMEAADGHGYARVLAWDADRGALLVERLGHDLWAEAPTLEGQVRSLVPLLRDAWQVPLDRGRPYQGKAAGLLEILADLGPRYGARHPDALAVATGCARELAASEQAEVVCHGDPHAGNVLRRGAGWALIDPDGFVGERAYDLGVVLRNGCREIFAAELLQPGAGLTLVEQGCRLLGELAGVDPGRVWRWGFVERVTSGLYLRWHGHVHESATFLDSAALLIAQRQMPYAGSGR